MRTEHLLNPCRSILAAVALTALAGCGTSHVGESWQCPLVQGSRCASVKAADPAVPSAVRRVELAPRVLADAEDARDPADGGAGEAGTSAAPPRALADPANVGRAVAADLAAGAPPENPAHSATVDPATHRIPEKTGRIWIAPWVDANGVFREGAWVRIVISPPAWRLP